MAIERLAAHNREWSARWRNWLAHAEPPWWAPGLVCPPDLRGRYECWLPAKEFRRTLCFVGRAFLPDESWLPYPLTHSAWPSLPDFWNALPRRFASRVQFLPEELAALFCALADPPRFGTDTGRYPRQRLLLECLLPDFAGQPLRILDLGCGVGLNTLETAVLAQERAPGAQLSLLGVTSEHLEVWMATRRTLPHDAHRQGRLRRYPESLPVLFRQGDATTFCSPTPFDLILCNGLVGGDYLHQDRDYRAFIQNCASQLAPRGAILLANRFHTGRRVHVERFITFAKQAGFTVSGDWQCLVLSSDRKRIAAPV
ncbi:MAG: hypothetical protein IJJ33_18530 [Victivallales bacterium]|nr:hypothetical protein [Victivallales bacterium]